MSDRTTLLELEERFWRAAGSRDAYEQHLASDAVHVFPGWGVTDRERALAGAAGAEPWATFSLENIHVVELADGVAALVYDAHATQASGGVYTAAMTSVYRREGESWKLVLHQQTPLESAADGSSAS